uniref:ROK family protein n=1 Tax=Paenarthrobacter ureafaciens TaxID=37931 RepID=UPI003F49ACD0
MKGPHCHCARGVSQGRPHYVDPGQAEGLANVEACSGLQAVLDPQLFIVGGGLAQLGGHLLHPVRTAYESYLPGAGDRPPARFAIAHLVNDAGLIGAADLAAP